MAGYLLPVPDITQSVVRPVVIQVCRVLQTHLNLGRDLDLVYAGDTLAIPQSGTNLSDKSDLPLLAGKEKLYVDFKEVPRRDSVRSTVTTTRDNPHLIEDKKIGWFVRPVMGDMDCSLSLTYRSSDKNLVEQWRDNFYTRLCMGAVSIQTDLNYSYPVSDYILAFIKQFWVNREDTAGYGDDFNTYLDNSVLVPHRYGTAFNGKWKTLLFDVCLKDVILILPSNDVPEVERVQEGIGATTYKSTFTVQFLYNRPINFNIQYPLFIHNQFISSKYFDKDLNRNKDKVLPITSSSTFLSTLLEWEQIKQNKIQTDDGYVIPEFDDWTIQHPTHQYKIAMQVLFSIDPNEPTKIVNLKELEGLGLYINPLIYPYIKESPETIFNELTTAVGFLIFNHQDQLINSQFYIDEDFTIWSKDPLDVRGHYHITMGVNKYLRDLSDRDMQLLSKHGQLALDCIEFLDNNVPQDKLPTLNSNGTVLLSSLIDSLIWVGSHLYKFGKQRVSYTINKIAIVTKKVNYE